MCAFSLRCTRVGFKFRSFNDNLYLILFWSIKISVDILDTNMLKHLFNLKLGTLTRSVCLHIFPTLYTTLPHNLIKDKLKEPSKQKVLLTLHITTETRLTSEQPKIHNAWSCQNVCDALTFLLYNLTL